MHVKNLEKFKKPGHDEQKTSKFWSIFHPSRHVFGPLGTPEQTALSVDLQCPTVTDWSGQRDRNQALAIVEPVIRKSTKAIILKLFSVTSLFLWQNFRLIG